MWDGECRISDVEVGKWDVDGNLQAKIRVFERLLTSDLRLPTPDFELLTPVSRPHKSTILNPSDIEKNTQSASINFNRPAPLVLPQSKNGNIQFNN